jgi:hypothetical protein
MKNIKLIFAILGFSLLSLSCTNDGGDSKLEAKYGAVIDVKKLNSTDSYINLISLQSGGDINLGFVIDVARGDVASLDVVGFYIKSDGTTTKGILSKGIKNLPYTLNIKKADLLNAFDNLNTTQDFNIGDQLTIGADLTLKDGTIIKLINDDGTNNFSTAIATSSVYKVTQSYNVSCSSDLGGTYNYTTTNASSPTGESAAGPLTGEVTFTDLGGGQYDISDASFGGWIGLYGPGNTAQKVQLKDICNKISYSGKDQFGEVFSFSNLVVNGNKISFNWQNDYGEKGTTTLTRKDNSNWPALTL